MGKQSMKDIAEGCTKIALAKGAKEAGAAVSRVREVSLEWRDGKVDRINEATRRGVQLQLYVDGRYSVASSSDLRPKALEQFIGDSVSNTRVLAEDPFRSLPDPSLYAGQAQKDLELLDPKYASVTPRLRREAAKAMEDAARAVKGAERILSVTSSFSDTRAEIVRVHSNGFEGQAERTSFATYAEVSVKDPDGRRPEDYSYASVRFLGQLPEAAAVGQEATERALSRQGAQKADSAVYTMVLDPRAGSRLVGAFGAGLAGSALQQKRSFLEGKAGSAIGSPALDVTDDPLVARGLASRLFDGEGIAAKRVPLVEKGVLKNYYIDTYYGKKLKMAPTTGGRSNLQWTLGPKSQGALLAEVGDAILVTGFIGGNSNSTTGDFSFGVQGFRVRGGKIAEPVSEMNISGNHRALWKRLVAVGNDPYPYSPVYTPTLVFEGVQFAGV
jgi:PmbA protein